MFETLPFDKNGDKVLCEQHGKNAQMMMDIVIKRMKAGESFAINDPRNETAILLIQGEVRICFEGQTHECRRDDPFGQLPFAAHVCKGVNISVQALCDSEVCVQQTENENTFPGKFYTPQDCDNAHSCHGKWEDCARRDVVTVFDYHNAPYSNMVLGEVIPAKGRWSSYVPHGHEQPEVYYYKFDKPQGFGACFVGENAYKIHDGSYVAVDANLTHPQVGAPGLPHVLHLDDSPPAPTIPGPTV